MDTRDVWLRDGSATPAKSDELIVLVTFSGGGIRGAALAYGVLEAMRETNIVWQGQKRRLIDEIDAISAVSGGSFTAAYYGLYGEKTFTDFRRDFLERDVQSDLLGELINPVNWLRMGSTTFDRSDLAHEYYDDILFHGATFRDIQSIGGPEIIINASDATLGTQFSFDQSQFAQICSNFLDFPIARAVTASSAVPVLFSSVIVRNYAGNCNYQMPQWAGEALVSGDVFTREYQLAKQLQAYQDTERRKFIHLYDGGLADNLGVRPFIQRVGFNGNFWETLKYYGVPNSRRMLLIVVNAQNATDDKPNRSEITLPLVDALLSATSVPIDRYSFETLELLRRSAGQWQEEINKLCENVSEQQSTERPCDNEFQNWLTVVDFEALTDDKERSYLQGLPTAMDLPDQDIDRLRRAAKQLLNDSPTFQSFLKSLD